jgi:uncharacterized protein YcsI (UPF0317 family)
MQTAIQPTIQALDAKQVRSRSRAGTFTGATSGHAYGMVQANLMIVPQEAAAEFREFCELNPKPCPLIEVLAAGKTEPLCAPGADIRSDLPGYRIFRDGKLSEEVADIHALWREDLVSFLIGCSFSFEEALLAAGVPLRHIELGVNVPMYRSNVACTPAGRFHGPMVVSMRPIPADKVSTAMAVTARFARVHGAPVHTGSPEMLGIDLSRPDYGDAVPVKPGEVPVFWACGVTPQAVALASGIPFCITHAPGKMFVTDLRNEDFAGEEERP